MKIYAYSCQMEEAATSDAVVVPYTELSEQALRGVIESVVLREGTDYGEREIAHRTKVDQILQQLRRGELQIVFDPHSESVDVVPRTPHRNGDL
ncbi:MAG: YheU family protein [Steroidobacteraceae bacterium]